MLIDREVLRLVLLEQCGGNLDNAVETLLAMQASSTATPTPSRPKQSSSPSSRSSQAAHSPSTTKRVYGPNEAILYDDNMREITLTDDFLQPPSFYLSTYYGLDAVQINNLQNNQRSQKEVQRALAKKPKKQLINIDARIIGQWTNLMGKYRFKNREHMDRLRDEMEFKSLNHCGSLVRVIFMMKLYQRLCNESGSLMNDKCGELMHQYLSERGFKEYSLTQLINDCNHLTQYHKFGGDHLKSMLDINERTKMENLLRSYFGHCDVMNCNIIQRIMFKDETQKKDEQSGNTEINSERDIVDKYHRVFFHPLN